MRIYLQENDSKRSVNVDNKVNLELSTSERCAPITSYASQRINVYDKYFAEKDASDTYRLIFTINPICSNILFNANTEIVYKEGSDDCKFISAAAGKNTSLMGIKDYALYMSYKGYTSTYTGFTRDDAIKDTAFSHPNIGNFTYHCGTDIFNNHTLRRKEFSPISKMFGASISANRRLFNTIGDYVRTADGEEVKERFMKINSEGKLEANKRPVHVYTTDNILSFQKAISEKLVESDGWVGFINPVNINVANYSKYTINKCINNRTGGEQIDMYPDRSLYSFVPKVNKYRGRVENNWDYCLTYPYRNYYNDLVEKNGINGLKCAVLSELTGTVMDKSQWEGNNVGGTEYLNVYLRTDLKNNFKYGTMINMTITYNNKSVESDVPIMVQGVGTSTGEDTAHVFSLRLEDLFGLVCNFNVGTFLDDGYFLNNLFEIRVRRNDNGNDCKYYFRQFRRLPNFNGSEVYSDETVSEEEVNTYCEVDYNSTLNKLAFSENIYSDNMAQIVFNDDVHTRGIKDNLGRDLSEIYLTIVKRNAGYKEWYVDKNYRSNKVEFSHCFGKVTSGLDLGPDANNYNVHKIHNIVNPTAYNYAISPNPLENDIRISGTTDRGVEGLFLGDVVEFSVTKLQETVLEDVYHRFNTAQREIYNTEFGTIKYDSVLYDDFDIDSSFTITTSIYGREGQIAMMPEGYYYKPHYRIALRQFDDTVKQGSDIRMGFSEIGRTGEFTFTGITSVPYYLNVGDKIDIYNVTAGTKIYGTVTNVSGQLFTEIGFTVNDFGEAWDISKLFIYKPNPERPGEAYVLNDGTGRYLWRDFMSSRDMIEGDELYNSIYTNDANYRHERINFYLRRQDPFGDYGLNTDTTLDYLTGASEGKYKDISRFEYIEENESSIC